MSKRSLPVVVSVGQQYLPEHTLLVNGISNALRSRDMGPELLTHDHWNPDAPIQSVVSYMRTRFGTIVIAFPRIHYEVAWEWPDSPRQVVLRSRDVASVWLQIEAALAFEIGHPILILVDDRLRPEGMLNPKHPAYHACYFNMAECSEELSKPLLAEMDDFALRVQRYAAPTTRHDSEVPVKGSRSEEGLCRGGR